MTLPQTAELSRQRAHFSNADAAHPAASTSSRVPRHHATGARASHGLSLRRTATTLGTAALALSAAASVDLQERGPGLGRLRIDQGGWRDGPWAPRPQPPTHKERLAADAIQRAPSCFDEGQDVLRGFWPDHQNFSLHQAYGVTLATSNMTDSTVRCVYSRAVAILLDEEAEEAERQYIYEMKMILAGYGAILFALLVGGMAAVTRLENEQARASLEPCGRQSGQGARAPLLPDHDVEKIIKERSYGTNA